MNKLNPMAAVIGATVITSSLSFSAMADNPFQAHSLSSGYQVAGADAKDAEGKCGGKEEGPMKSAEGKCGAKEDSSKKDAEGKCGAKEDESKKDAEGKCGAKG
jgi:uncharacterized low-complexity protein